MPPAPYGRGEQVVVFEKLDGAGLKSYAMGQASYLTGDIQRASALQQPTRGVVETPPEISW